MNNIILHRLDAYHVLKRFISKNPALYFALTQHSHLHRFHRVYRKTDIVIEGFPRSANTFAVLAFQEVQKKSFKIAHHLHVPAQYIYSIRLNIPTIILVRNPIDAVISLVIRSPYIDMKNAFKDYIAYYCTLLSYDENYVVAPFEDVINNYHKIICLVNKKCNVNFELYFNDYDKDHKILTAIKKKEKEYKIGSNNLTNEKSGIELQSMNKKEYYIETIKTERILKALSDRSMEIYKKVLDRI